MKVVKLVLLLVVPLVKLTVESTVILWEVH